MKKLLLALVLAIFLATSIAVVGVEFGMVTKNEVVEEIVPENIWEYNQYKANTHTHTKRSDGDYTPQEIVNIYESLGYDVFAISDHYFTFETFESIGITDYSVTPIASVEAEGLVAHINLYYLDPFYKVTGPLDMFNTAEYFFEITAELGGICVLNHPGRYKDPDDIDYVSPEKRINWFRKYPQIVAMEIVNRKNRYDDIGLWDEILTELMPERIVYGVGADDTHDKDDIGWSYTIFQAPDRSEESIEHAFRNGHYYTCSTAYVQNPEGESPRITNLTEATDGTLTVEGTDYEQITWISCGEIVGYGESFNPQNCSKYVRFELVGKGGTAFSQPIPLY